MMLAANFSIAAMPTWDITVTAQLAFSAKVTGCFHPFSLRAIHILISHVDGGKVDAMSLLDVQSTYIGPRE